MIFVSPDIFTPLYPLSPAKIRIVLPYRRCACSLALSIVWPSYSFLNDMAPMMMPFHRRMMETLLPNSYFLCSLPLQMQRTSGSWSEYILCPSISSPFTNLRQSSRCSRYLLSEGNSHSNSLTSLPAMVRILRSALATFFLL